MRLPSASRRNALRALRSDANSPKRSGVASGAFDGSDIAISSATGAAAGLIRIDMAVPALRWAVEVDVHPDHLSLEGTTGDKQRDRQLHLVDWEVERVTALELLNLPAILDELVELYRARSSRAA